MIGANGREPMSARIKQEIADMTTLELARMALSNATFGKPETVADLTVLFKNDDGTWSVCDNGEEVVCKTESEVIRIICKNLS